MIFDILDYLFIKADSLNYLIIFLLMILEAVIFPIPSESILALSGFLVAQGKFNFIYVLVISTFGSLLGSLILYFAGKYGGRPFVMKYGRYFGLKHHQLDKAEEFFNQKRGEELIIISRFVPVVRSLIAIPAGVAEMKLIKFISYTSIGAIIWNAILIFIGYKLGTNWNLIKEFSIYFEIFGAVILVGLLFYWFHRRRKKK